MEKQIFDWKFYEDSSDDFDMFSGITLKVDVGPWKAGHVFPREVFATVMRDTCELILAWPAGLIDVDEVEETYELHLTVGKRVEKTP